MAELLRSTSEYRDQSSGAVAIGRISPGYYAVQLPLPSFPRGTLIENISNEVLAHPFLVSLMRTRVILSWPVSSAAVH